MTAQYSSLVWMDHSFLGFLVFFFGKNNKNAIQLWSYCALYLPSPPPPQTEKAQTKCCRRTNNDKPFGGTQNWTITCKLFCLLQSSITTDRHASNKKPIPCCLACWPVRCSVSHWVRRRLFYGTIWRQLTKPHEWMNERDEFELKYN